MQDVILHPVCINRLVVNLPAPSSHVFSYASRSRSTRRDLHYRGILSTDRALLFPFTYRHLDEKP